MQILTVQMNIAGEWCDVAMVGFYAPEKGTGGPCVLHYDIEHVTSYFHQFAQTAVSVSLPVDNIPLRSPHWHRFLEDIMPAGSSRDYWVKRLGLQDLPNLERDFQLLKYGTIAPIGNLRIKESVPEKAKSSLPVTFSIADVSELQIDFIEYAQSRGAAAGGASGAGGAAPKLLVRLNEQQGVWIDTFQDVPRNLDQPYLVKFPRGKTTLDSDILRAEYHFYHELTQLGFETISVESMKLIEAERGPSLWLPRFDYGIEAGAMVSYGMESVYAILGEPTAKPLLHADVIRRLLAAFNKKENYGNTRTLLDVEAELEGLSGIEAFVVEWVRRDLLNIAFGNSDNHGRNTSFIKYGNRVQLAPIYDFAPMKADYEMITRTFTWGEGMELGGVYHFPAIAEHLADLLSPNKLMSALNETAVRLLGLEQRLRQRGVPESILTHSGIGFATLEARMQRWGLL